MSIEIINGYKDGWAGENTVYIGRASPKLRLSRSPLANPYTIGKDGDRTEVIERYRRWLWNRIKANDETVLAELRRIAAMGEVKLACYCKPNACHGDVIKSCINWLIKVGTYE